jgi:ribosomal protein S18 acetylase RimI-like enzyme
MAKKMTSIVSVKDKTNIRKVEQLAKTIWIEYYTAIIGKNQVDYMLKNFQSEKAINEQINQGAQYFLIFIDNTAVGYFSIQKKDATIFLSKLYVLKEMRGKGIGLKAMNFIVLESQKSACKYITLTVNKYNTNAIKAYQSMGFEIIEKVVADIGNNFVMDDYVMKKEVNN